MFGHESKPSRIYSYKVKTILNGEDRVLAQIRLAHQYKNKLIELERSRREAVEAAVNAHNPEIPVVRAELAGIEEHLTAIHAAIKARSQAERVRATPTPAERTELAHVRRLRREQAAQLKALRKAAFADPVLQAALGPIEGDHLAACKAARAASQLYWGTYAIVEQALGNVRTGAPPAFRSWDGSGAVAVQLQGGLAWPAALLAADTRLQIALQPLTARPTMNQRSEPISQPDPDNPQSRAHRRPRARVRFRIGTEPDGRTPLWAELLVHLHRMPPADSVVKWAKLYRTLVGRRVVWKVQFVLARDSWARDDLAETGTVGLDINWRALPEGLRVAYAVGDDGSERTLILPRAWLSAWSKVESLQAIRDRNFNAIRETLNSWIHDQKKRPRPGRGPVPIPEWFTERTQTLGQWRSSDRLGALTWHWRDQRFAGDGIIFEQMEAWRQQDRHLHDWQDSQAKKAVRRRDDHLYRKFVLGLARDFHTVKIEAINWKAIAALPEPDETDCELARIYRRIAAPGRLAQLVKEVAAVTVRVPAANTTKRCHVCGVVGKFDGVDLFHTCTACGARWDIDRNAAINILASAEPRGGEEGEPGAEDAQDAA
jgi:hypothetical protein